MPKSKLKHNNLFLEEPAFIKNVRHKKVLKVANSTQMIEPCEDEASDLLDSYPNNKVTKKQKLTEDDSKEPRQKLLHLMENQLDTRKQGNTKLLRNLLDTVNQLEADHEALKENEQKLEQIASILVKCIQQASTAQKHTLQSLKDIYTSFKKEVEGLLTRGALKPDDRPLWFDVYKAFPPHTEPKFARPKPEIKPIKALLFQEDVLRVKFHTQGHGMGAVNMLINSTGDTQTKRLLQQYGKLKAQGVPESDLIDKSVEAAGANRPERPANSSPKTISKEPEASLKDIFKE